VYHQGKKLNVGVLPGKVRSTNSRQTQIPIAINYQKNIASTLTGFEHQSTMHFGAYDGK